MVPDYIAAVLADSPSAFWELQDAADFPQDSSGNANHMDAKSVVTSLAYRTLFGPMSSFSVNQQTTALRRNADTVLTAVDNVTMEVWVRNLSSGATLEVFFLGNASGVTNAAALGSNGWGLTSSNVGRPGVRVLNGGALHDAVSTTSTLTGGNWQHFVILRRSGTWEMWVNGVQDTSIGAFAFAPGAYAGQIVYLGQADATAGRTQTFQSAFAALYPVALSGSRIAAHYNAMFTWGNAQVELDENPTGVVAGAFTTCDAGQGIVPDRPYHYAEYEELSWLTTGDANISYAGGAGVSVFPP